MEDILVDTSVWVEGLRQDNLAIIRSAIPDAALWLSAVVLAELYAGARGRQRQAVDDLEHESEALGRLLVPNLEDWRRTGQVLAEVTVRFGYEAIGRNRLTNDALIACGAGRKGLTVLTANRRDFGRLAEIVPFQWRLAGPPR